MVKQPEPDMTERPADGLDARLGYIWEDPPPPHLNPSWKHIWLSQPSGPVANLASRLANGGHRVSDLRDQTAALGFSPQGRTRTELAQNLAEVFLDSARLAGSLASISETLQQQYVRLLLHSFLTDSHTQPASKGLWAGKAKYSSEMIAQLRRADLVLDDSEGQAFVPFNIRRRLPSMSISLPEAPEPATCVPAEDPRAILGQLQQLIYLLQSHTARLRPVLRWQSPNHAHIEPPRCWPVSLEDAKALQGKYVPERTVTLLPPSLLLDDASLALCTAALGVSEHRVTLLYRLLVLGGIIEEGSPVTVAPEAAQKWFSTPPGQQVTAIYGLYRNIDHWAAWWPLWRSGTVTVGFPYHGYWSLTSLESTVRDSARILRHVVLDTLSFLPDRTWIAIQDLVRWLRRLFPTPNTHRYLMGLTPEHAEDGWPGFLDSVVTTMLAGPLRAMGLVDLGPSLDDVRVVRFRGLQDLHWERVSKVTIDDAGSPTEIDVRYDAVELTLEAQTPVPPAFMAYVLHWTKPAGFSQTSVRYALDSNKLYAAFESGADPESLAQEWQTHVGTAPIAEITTWWHDRWQRYGRIRIYAPHAMLHTRDEMTMQEIRLSLPDIDRAVVCALTPESALLERESADQVLEDLSRQGYMPKEVG